MKTNLKTKLMISMLVSALLTGCGGGSTTDPIEEPNSDQQDSLNKIDESTQDEQNPQDDNSAQENENPTPQEPKVDIEEPNNPTLPEENSNPVDTTQPVVKTSSVVGLVGANPANKITPELAKSANLTKGLTVFGINLLATSEVPDAKLLHAANILAELIDNNEDGKPDNEKVHNLLVTGSAYETMYNLAEGNQVEIDNDILREVSKVSTTLGAYETRDNYADGVNHDASIEEIFHLITQFGYSAAYPDVFLESNNATSQLALAMDVARGGRVTVKPDTGWSYPDSAWYFYSDDTADYATMMTEYIYWSVSSNFGMHDSEPGLQKTSSEWKPNTKEKLRVQDPTIYGLINDPQYAFPQVLPDANYKFYKFVVQDIKKF